MNSNVLAWDLCGLCGGSSKSPNPEVGNQFDRVLLLFSFLEGRRTRRCAIEAIVPMQMRGARSLVRRVLFRPMRHGKGSHEGKTGAIRFAPREDMERETHPDHLDRHFEVKRRSN